MNNKGLSVIVGTMLIILMTIAAVGIFWIGYNKLTKDNISGNSLDCATINLEISKCIFAFKGSDLDGNGGADLQESAVYINFRRKIGDGNINSVRIIAESVGIAGSSLNYQSYVLEPQAITNKFGVFDNYYGDLVEFKTDEAINLGGVPVLTAVLSANIAAVAGNTICPEKNEPVECECRGPPDLNNPVWIFLGDKTCREELSAIGLL